MQMNELFKHLFFLWTPIKTISSFLLRKAQHAPTFNSGRALMQEGGYLPQILHKLTIHKLALQVFGLPVPHHAPQKSLLSSSIIAVSRALEGSWWSTSPLPHTAAAQLAGITSLYVPGKLKQSISKRLRPYTETSCFLVLNHKSIASQNWYRNFCNIKPQEMRRKLSVTRKMGRQHLCKQALQHTTFPTTVFLQRIKN